MRRRFFLVSTLLLLLFRSADCATRDDISMAYEPGSETVWVFELDGKPFGYCWSRYDGKVDVGGASAHSFTEQVSLQMPVSGGVLEQQFQLLQWLDENGNPLRFDFMAQVAGSVSSIKASIKDGVLSADIRQGPRLSQRETEFPKGAHLLANNFISNIDLHLVICPESKDQPSTLFSVNSLKTLPYQLTQIKEEGDKTIYSDTLGETLILDENQRLIGVEVPAQKLVMRKSEETYTPFTLELPVRNELMAGLDQEEVLIEYDDVSLAGTITRPPRQEEHQGPLPSLFFISGSGGQDRHGFGGSLDLGTHEILDHLTREGFLVLRVDDRGVGESKGPPTRTFEDLVEDARRCVEYLRSRDDVDPERIGIIGHSEGGATAPILAAESPNIPVIVLMAASGRTIDVLIHEQLVRSKRLEGVSDKDLQEYSDQLKSALVEFGGATPLNEDTTPKELIAMAAMRPWYQSHTKQDPIENIKQVKGSVLLLQGAKDIQVSSERDAPLLHQALKISANADHKLVVFPKLDHLFKKSDSEMPTGLEYLEDRPIDSEFLAVLTTWLKERLM